MTSTAQRPSLALDIVLYQRGRYWIAHCHNLDILTSAPDQRTVEEDIVRICIAQIRFAYQNGLLADMFRPPNPEVTKMLYDALDDGHDLELVFNRREVIDHKAALCFNVYRKAA